MNDEIDTIKEVKNFLEIDFLQLFYDYLPNVINFTISFVLAVIFFLAGWLFVNFLVQRTNAFLKDIDEVLVNFCTSLLSILLKTMLIISFASMIGIKTTSFLALLGAASLAVGLALQGSLSNFAGGVLILIFRPFKVGDLISTTNFSGRIKSISVFHTTLKTSDNKILIIPNSILSNGIITNFSTENERRVDFQIPVIYKTDIAKAKNILIDIVSKDKRIIQRKEITVAVGEITNIGIILYLRIWVWNEDYWNVFYDINEEILQRFVVENIEISSLTHTTTIVKQ